MTAARHAALQPARSPWWTPLVQWQNWRLLVKMAAVLVVPALLAVGLGVVQIDDDVQRANSYAQLQRLVTMRGELRTLLEAVQMERTMSVERLSGGTVVGLSDLREQTRLVDRAEAVVATTRTRQVPLTGVAANRYSDAAGLLTRLPALRTRVASDGIASGTALQDYDTITKGLLNLDQALVSTFAAPQLNRQAAVLYDLEAVEEQIHLQHAILLQAVGKAHPMTPTITKALQESDARLRDRLGDFENMATRKELGDYRRTVTGPAVSRRAHMVSEALTLSSGAGAAHKGATSLPLSADGWNRDSETTGTLVDKSADKLLDTLRTTSADLQDRTSNQAGIASVILFGVLLLALSIGFAIGRHLLRSLTVLHATAREVAEHRLPAAVMGLREGREAETTVDAVPVHTTEEFGQLARAFDTVHSQAVRLAAEQAALRGDLRNTLVNLSRRSQSLVDRLLLLMEQLERHEEDPEQLASLFTLDHLATRMRRNNENMMVLCGSSLVRSSRGAPLDAVLRGAVSEIEHYQRVLVQPGPAVAVVGYAAGDLGRLVAELLDNATVFSPPQTQVVVSSALGPDGSVLVEVHDEGIGMSARDLALANQRVAADTAADAPSSLQLGLFVVGRLAGRHGIGVSLRSHPGVRGLRARVLVPARLITSRQPAHTGRPLAMAQGPAAAMPPTRPVRPVRADEAAPARPGGSSWFALATPEPVAPRTGKTTDTPASRPAAKESDPLPSPTPGPDRSVGVTQAGLPRRAPRTPSAPARTERPTTESAPAASAAASRVHSFLSSYQTGIRRAQPDQTQDPSATGRKNP